MTALVSMAWSNRPARSDNYRDWLKLSPDGPSLTPFQPTIREDMKAEGVPPPQSVIRLVAGSFAEPVSQIWVGGRIKEYLTSPDARRHLWHAWLSSDRMNFTAQNRMSADLAYDRLTFLKGRDLVTEAYGHQPPGLAKALSRLGAEARRPEFYRALVRALSTNGAGAKFLQHTPELSDSIVLGLAGLPAGLITKAIVELLKRSHVAPEALGFFTWTLARLEILLGPGVSHSILQAPNPLEAMWDAILSLPFPNAPWSDTNLVVSITSRSELQRIAQKFQNCLSAPDRQRSLIVSILNGERYLFAWRGKEPALLEYRRIGQIGWYLDQVRGPRNIPVSQSTMDMIYDTLKQVQIFCPSRDDRPRYFDEDELLRGLPI